MINADGYLESLEERLAADGCAVTHEGLGLVAYKTQMRALVRGHVFLVATKAGAVDETAVAEFGSAAVNLAVERKGQWRGFQSGVIVLPVIVAESADQSAVAMTQRVHRLNLGGFAVMAQPAVVDLATGRSHLFRGTRLWGYAFNSLIKKKLALYLPDPA
ncbi:hypothetical protein Ais01nite_05630 [Asanoa ishikariensis]|uniref:Uncharacterized protein n=1 Tax=Asanoa ishikariensis TaxID=137265 RepID=A0A1H3TFE3_9ACTN|nr:hypothetical protein [Asanoa ishikariensis]GIF62528.1 hypothetical protein Ais01nite_05630 [Asanoa ishikariensis]SDZ48992.1 hypothetical protein SAMN05421684_5670 [Asanoa ishikariensis]